MSSMSIYSKPGTKVRFVEESPITFGVPAVNALHLTVGNVYTIESIEIHRWHTKVFLKEVPDVEFNSVWFEVVDVK